MVLAAFSSAFFSVMEDVDWLTVECSSELTGETTFDSDFVFSSVFESSALAGAVLASSVASWSSELILILLDGGASKRVTSIVRTPSFKEARMLLVSTALIVIYRARTQEIDAYGDTDEEWTVETLVVHHGGVGTVGQCTLALHDQVSVIDGDVQRIGRHAWKIDKSFIAVGVLEELESEGRSEYLDPVHLDLGLLSKIRIRPRETANHEPVPKSVCLSKYLPRWRAW